MSKIAQAGQVTASKRGNRWSVFAMNLPSVGAVYAVGAHNPELWVSLASLYADIDWASVVGGQHQLGELLE